MNAKSKIKKTSKKPVQKAKSEPKASNAIKSGASKAPAMAEKPLASMASEEPPTCVRYVFLYHQSTPK